MSILLCAGGGKREVEQLNKTLVAEFERLGVCELRTQDWAKTCEALRLCGFEFQTFIEQSSVVHSSQAT